VFVFPSTTSRNRFFLEYAGELRIIVLIEEEIIQYYETPDD